MSKVLLIEDDAAVRDGLRLALSRQGHSVHAVASGEQGLDLLADSEVVVPTSCCPGWTASRCAGASGRATTCRSSC